MICEEFINVNDEIQWVIGEDDLVSIGMVCCLFGMCFK